MSKFDIYQEVTDTIMSSLEAGTVPWRKPWRWTGEVNAHRNYASKRPYRGINVWLLDIAASAHGWEHPYWVTFKGAQSLGGCVRKGEKSTMVVFWKMLQTEDEKTGKKVTIPILRYFRVFNIAQCDDIPEPEARTDERTFDPIEEAQAIIDGMPQAPSIAHDGRDRAFYIPQWDEIHLPKQEDFISPEAYYHTAFHEMVHSTGHSSRLNRKELQDMKAFGDHAYSKEELTAEMGAAMLCGMAGLAPATLDQSAAYIASWLRALQNDRKLVVTAAARAQKAADLIIGDAAEDHEAETATLVAA